MARVCGLDASSPSPCVQQRQKPPLRHWQDTTAWVVEVVHALLRGPTWSRTHHCHTWRLELVETGAERIVLCADGSTGIVSLDVHDWPVGRCATCKPPNPTLDIADAWKWSPSPPPLHVTMPYACENGLMGFGERAACVFEWAGGSCSW
jgi:hypothetical protein